MTGQDRKNVRTASFGAGCFWGVEAVFRQVKGVVETAVGFMGGTVKNPTYHRVCEGDTGHTEVVQVTYDPAVVSYDALLDVFFANHDPTTPGRQGPDFGQQYRSVIFFHYPEQKNVAEAKITALEASGRFRNRIVTAVEPAEEFYRAEEYHQRYYEKSGRAGCGR